MTSVEKISAYRDLYRLVLPHLPEPSVQDAARWLDYDPAIVEKAILRTGRRFAPQKVPPGFNPAETYRYVTAIARAETNETDSLATAQDEQRPQYRAIWR